MSEAVETGAKRRTFVVAGGTEIARQAYSEESEQVVGFVHRDASGLSGRSTNAGTGTASSTYASVAEEFDALGNNVGIRGRLGDTANPPRVLLASGYFYSDDVNDPYFTISEYGRSASDSAKRRLFDPNDGGLTVIHELLHFNFHDLTLANALGGGFKNL